MSSIALRIPDSLLSSAKELASAENTTLNQFLAIAIAEKVSSMKTVQFFSERAAQADPAAALAVLAKVPRSPPSKEDRIPESMHKRLRARLHKAPATAGQSPRPKASK